MEGTEKDASDHVLTAENAELRQGLSNMQNKYEKLEAEHQLLQQNFLELRNTNAEYLKREQSFRNVTRELRQVKTDHLSATQTIIQLHTEMAKLRQNQSRVSVNFNKAFASNASTSEAEQSFSQFAASINAAAYPQMTPNVPMPPWPGPQQQQQIPLARSKPHQYQPTSIIDGKKKWLCSLCHKFFSRKEHLKRHQTTMHTDHKPHQCVLCGASFARSDHLRLHRRKDHRGTTTGQQPDQSADDTETDPGVDMAT